MQQKMVRATRDSAAKERPITNPARLFASKLSHQDELFEEMLGSVAFELLDDKSVFLLIWGELMMAFVGSLGVEVATIKSSVGFD